MVTGTMNRRAVHRGGIDRRTLLRRTALLAATSYLTLGLAAVELPAAAKPRSRKSRPEQEKSHKAEAEGQDGNTVTRTFSSPNAVTLNDDTSADPYPATIQVSGFKKGKVIDVNVVLRGVNHGYADDIDVLLVAPNGSSTILMSDAGGFSSPSSLTLRIDDQAGGSLPDGSGLTSGSFKPADYGPSDNFPGIGGPPTTASLARLNGSNPNGEWRLYVVDDDFPDAGSFSGGWDLELTVKLDKKKHKHGGKK